MQTLQFFIPVAYFFALIYVPMFVLSVQGDVHQALISLQRAVR